MDVDVRRPRTDRGQRPLPAVLLRGHAGDEDLAREETGALRGIRDQGDSLLIGAMTPHHEVATSPLVAEHLSLLSRATQTVADPQIRHRGTFGGALVHADPAGDLPAPALVLDAEFLIAGND